jgi:hypothetical protein
MAKYFNKVRRQGSTLQQISGHKVKNQWTYYFNKYRAVKQLNKKQSAYIVDHVDRAKGITTLEEKNNTLCPLCDKMDFFSKECKYLSRGSICV